MVDYRFYYRILSQWRFASHRFFILASLLYNGCEYLFNIGNTDGLKYVVYFADPYASWQKGAVENTNKLIRFS